MKLFMALKRIGLSIIILVSLVALSFTLKVSGVPDDVIQDDVGLTVEDYLKRINAPDPQDRLVMVYFHADWCVPCLQLKPVIEKVSVEQKAICRVLKLDSDANPKVATQLEINTLPLFLFYKKGKLVHRHEGFLPEKELISRIATYK